MTWLVGTLHTWNDEKGFGFIKQNSGERDVFVHIRDFVNSTRRPLVGDTVLYRIKQDANGRLKAYEASIKIKDAALENLDSQKKATSWLIGTLQTWDDTKGFGFIKPRDGGQNIFVHIKDFKHDTYRPLAGGTILYRIKHDENGKLKAYDAMISEEQHKQLQTSKTSPTTWFMVFSPFVLSLYAFYKSHSLAPLLIYSAMGLATFILYSVDKQRAQKRQWRIPEKSLHFLELSGGWPGALLAQSEIRHKRIKTSYQIEFWLIVSLHACIWIDYLFLHYIPYSETSEAVAAMRMDFSNY